MAADSAFSREALRPPRSIELDECEFPIDVGTIDNYKVLTLPPALRALFDEEGAGVVRVNSLKVAQSLPDFGGKTSADYSLPPHQDSSVCDPKRFTILSKLTEGARGSSTLVFSPAVAKMFLPFSQQYYLENRTALKNEKKYDPNFAISEEDYNACFETEGGYAALAKRLAGERADEAQKLFVEAGLLGYLIRGPHADELMEKFVQIAEGMYVDERWEKPGIVIIDNHKVFHARRGGNNPPLKRNLAV